MIRDKLSRLNSALQIVLSALCFIAGLASEKGIHTLLFIFAGLILIPLKQVRKFFSVKEKMSLWIPVSISAILFGTGMGFAGFNSENAMPENTAADFDITDSFSTFENLITETELSTTVWTSVTSQTAELTEEPTTVYPAVITTSETETETNPVVTKTTTTTKKPTTTEKPTTVTTTTVTTTKPTTKKITTTKPTTSTTKYVTTTRYETTRKPTTAVRTTQSYHAAAYNQQSDMVWIPTNGGHKYHTNPNCSQMIDPDYVSVSEAEAMGFEPCGKCYK